jgi:beta-lactamase superfamily II metal-dependent hydrolase
VVPAASRADDPPAEAARALVRVRMYRVGLGDCFLLTFGPGTPAEAHMLIDIGTIGQGDGIELEEAVEDILATTKGRLEVAVATHEHADHLSGFERLAKAGVEAKEVWLAWTEDPHDPLARRLVKYRGDLFDAVEESGLRLEAAPRSATLAAVQDGLPDLLEFIGLHARRPETLAAAVRSGGLKARLEAMMRAAQALSPRRPRYCAPGTVLEPAWAPGVRFYVLGPPRDEAAIRRLGEHGSPDLYELAFAAGVQLPAPGEGAASTEEEWEPFDREQMIPREQAPGLGGVADAYRAEPWRQIDDTNLGAAADLALQLDNVTNNTSLVLAVEVGDEVLLLPGDAQLGSWLTWPEVRFAPRGGGEVTGKDLLRRTTFYKVGHHGSHNATARPGLELMGERGLTAFIPLDERVARRRHWPMPARRLHERLVEKTHGRVTKSDADARPGAIPGVTVSRTYVEVLLPLEGAPDRPTTRRVTATADVEG